MSNPLKYLILNLKVQLISDTHGKHHKMSLDYSCDTIVHAGDSTNYYDLPSNNPEFLDFIDWYSKLPIRNKILIAGNHDAWATKKFNREKCKSLGIIYLEDSYITIDGKVFCGSPWVPNYGKWHFMKNRSKLHSHWDGLLDYNIDLLITHTPPKGVLDLSYSPVNSLEFCGCNGLLKAVLKYKPKHHVFGHIHNNSDIVNFGTRSMSGINFHNAPTVRDGDWDSDPVNSNGILIEI